MPTSDHSGRWLYTCSCGHLLIAFGTGRHRLWFETKDLSRSDPLLEDVCSHCGASLVPSFEQEIEAPMRFLLGTE